MVIEDVEMRYVVRGVPTPEFGEGVGKLVPALQMRKLERRTWHDVHYIDGQERHKSGNEAVWTDWQDVPMVEHAA